MSSVEMSFKKITMILLSLTFILLTSIVRVKSSCSEDAVITRDICIIGGGSSGTYAAVQLHKAGKSIALVEKEDVLGGHTNTYTDPETNKPIDYGVVFFENLPVVNEYFRYLQVPWIYNLPTTTENTNFDFSTDQLENNFTVPNPQASLQTYLAQLNKYPSLQDGFYLPNPIPDDILLPFGEFVNKYKLDDAVSLIFRFAQGLGDILRQPTLYVLKNFSLNVVVKDLIDGFIVTKSGDNSIIYSNAYKMLKDNVFLKSHATRVKRTGSNLVEVTIKTPTGRKLIRAKKLLVTIPPVKLNGFDLNPEERRIFSQFSYTRYYTSLIRNTGIPTNTSINSINLKNLYGLPTLPGIYGVETTVVDGIVGIKYCSPHPISDDDVKADIIESIYLLQRKGVAKKTGKSPEFVAFNSHTPFELTVPVKAIRAGFYDQLYDLQGKRNTFWTGAAFHTHNSGLLWQFTKDNVLPRLIDDL